jgi:hypothetical protein
MSFGVMRDGTVPRSTAGAAGLGGAGSGAPHGLLSAAAREPQGSEKALLLDGNAAGLGAGGCVFVGWEERLKAELKSLDDFVILGEVTLGAVTGAGGAADCVGGADDHPPKSSPPNMSSGIETGLAAGTGAGFGAGGAAGVAFWVKEKLRLLFA